MLGEWRRTRSGSVLAVQVLLSCAAGRTPAEIATLLFCSRSSVYRIVSASHAQRRGAPCETSPAQAGWLSPSLRRRLLALLAKVPAAYGWGRTRWSWATLVAHLTLQRGVVVAASTMRRWLPARGWVWKRAQLVARDDDPQRVAKLARSRHTLETLGKRAVVLFADELDIPLLPKVGYQWMPKGEAAKIVTPGQNQQHSLAGALEPRTGRLVHCTSTRKTNALCRALWDRLDWLSPKAQCSKVYPVVDNSGIPKAKAVERGLAAHPRFTFLCLPTYCPEATPIERAFGEAHDKCTRTHHRTRIAALVWDVEQPFLTNGPWHYHLSYLYYTPEVTAAMNCLTQHQHLSQAA
jgi:transposase